MKKIINIILFGIFFLAIIASIIPDKSNKKINLSESSLAPLPLDIVNSGNEVKLATVSKLIK